MKMSNHKKGDWQATWDGLFWRFMHTQSAISFCQNPRLGMLVRMFDKMPAGETAKHIEIGESYLQTLKILAAIFMVT